MKKILIAARGFFAVTNGYELTAMIILIAVLVTLIFGRPSPDHLVTALRFLALAIALAAKFFSNSALSNQPGTSADQAASKKLSLVLDVLAALFAAISFAITPSQSPSNQMSKLPTHTMSTTSVAKSTQS